MNLNLFVFYAECLRLLHPLAFVPIKCELQSNRKCKRINKQTWNYKLNIRADISGFYSPGTFRRNYISKIKR